MENANLMKGLLGGLALGIAGAFLFQVVGSNTGYIFDFMAIVSGGIGGLGFGLLCGEKDSFALHTMGGAVGYVAIILGYYLVYISPVSGYEFPYGAYSVVPADVVSFGEYMTYSLTDSVWNILFFVLGIVFGSKAAVYAANKRG